MTTRPSVARGRGYRQQAAFAGLLPRLTDRDQTILDLVYEHRLFTTDQLTKIFFHSASTARPRLAILHRLGALERFRLQLGTTNLPAHWVIGRTGAHVVAARRGVLVKDLGYRREQTTGFVLSQLRSHQLGINDFFTDLHHTARTQPGRARLDSWWSEKHCGKLWGHIVRPDAFGRWTETQKSEVQDPGIGESGAEESGRQRVFEFMLEHDTGTEPLPKVAAKLDGYAKLTRTTGIRTPVLFWLPNATREANLRRLFSSSPADVPAVPVATAVHTTAGTGDGPAGPVWLPAGITGPRRRLIDLQTAWDEANQPRRGR